MLITLGTTDIEMVSGQTQPSQPNEEPTFNWATSRIEAGTPVRMVTGAMWRVQRPPVRQPNSSIDLMLRDPVRKTTASFNVPVDVIDAEIWNVGYVPPEPEILEPPTPIEPVPPTPNEATPEG